MTKIVVNGRAIEADPKKPLIAACAGNGFDVPTYCYHPGLTPVGSCRICQVEVKQGDLPARVVVACRTPVAEGMIVDTESERAHQTRRDCLEFLLKNHPLDCPICDKAGECDLQDFAYQEGQAKGRTHEPRRKLEKRKSLGDVIVLDEERCILCSRCVRFFEEVPKKPQLTVADLGSRSVIATFQDRPLTGNYQGNIADLCPVGALTLKSFRFEARVWNLVKMASTCAECSRGCSTQVEVLRGGEVKRIRPRENPEVNGWWMCDVGRFALRPLSREDRVSGALIRGAGGLEGSLVEDALAFLADVLAIHPEPLLLASPFLTLEEGEAVLAFARERGLPPRFLSPPPNGLRDDLLHTGDPCPNRRGLQELGFEPLEPAEVLAKLQGAKSAVLIGDRIAELVGLEALATLPPSLRLVVFDCYAFDVPALDALIGLPTHVERTGTWVNVDGRRGPISAAKPPPRGVRTIVQHLQALRATTAPGAAKGSAAFSAESLGEPAERSAR